MRGPQNDTDFTHLYMLEPAQVIYLSRERTAFAKLMAKPAHQDRACPYHSPDYCDDDGSTWTIFTVNVVMGQLIRRRGHADAGFVRH